MTTKSYRIAIGADHGGFELKEFLKASLGQRGHQIDDCGTHSEDAVDYPTIAHAVAERVSKGRAEVGIMVDRAGLGSAMAANKLTGVRAALCYDLSTARNSREHNNANVLTLGAGLIGPDLALQIAETWLATECTVDRHLRRAGMIEHDPGPTTTAGCSCATGSACSCCKEDSMDSLSDCDIERIINRMTELSSDPSSAAAQAACVFCQSFSETNPEFMRKLLGMGAERVGHIPGNGTVPQDLAKYIDHTLLKPDASASDVEALCAEAADHSFASVCVNPTYVKLVAKRLQGTPVKVCAVVGFPLGAHVPEIKGLEARRAIRDGANEIDMVINVGALKSHDDEGLYRDIRAVVEACMDGGAICKVILETALLNDDEKRRACQAARRARADFVKTSTGFGGGGATAHDVALMADAVRGTHIEVKASGGIRSYEDAQKMIEAGATRLGASAGVKILKEARGLTVSTDTEAGRY
jgi:deoxyribose-phosphate aldolase